MALLQTQLLLWEMNASEMKQSNVWLRCLVASVLAACLFSIATARDPVTPCVAEDCTAPMAFGDFVNSGGSPRNDGGSSDTSISSSSITGSDSNSGISSSDGGNSSHSSDSGDTRTPTPDPSTTDAPTDSPTSSAPSSSSDAPSHSGLSTAAIIAISVVVPVAVIAVVAVIVVLCCRRYPCCSSSTARTEMASDAKRGVGKVSSAVSGSTVTLANMVQDGSSAKAGRPSHVDEDSSVSDDTYRDTAEVDDGNSTHSTTSSDLSHSYVDRSAAMSANPLAWNTLSGASAVLNLYEAYGGTDDYAQDPVKTGSPYLAAPPSPPQPSSLYLGGHGYQHGGMASPYAPMHGAQQAQYNPRLSPPPPLQQQQRQRQLSNGGGIGLAYCAPVENASPLFPSAPTPLQRQASLLSIRSQGFSIDEADRFYRLRHRESSDADFGVFLDIDDTGVTADYGDS